MSTVLEQLVEITGLKYEGMKAQDFLNEMIRAVNELSEEDWNRLPADGQQWFNDAAKVVSEDEEADIPEIPGMEEVASDDEPEKEEEEKKDKKDSEKSDKRDSKEPEKKEPEKKEPKKKRTGPSAGSIVRSILLDNKDLTLDEVMEELAEREVDMKRSSAQVIYQGTTRTIAAILEHGSVLDKEGTKVLKVAK